jgi:hypothetical protein
MNMVKKVMVGLGVAAVSGLLIYGAVNRTTAKAQQVNREPLARGSAGRVQTVSEAIGQGQGRGSGSGGQGRNGGSGNGAAQAASQQALASDYVAEGLSTLTGNVVELADDSVVIETVDGQQVILDGMPLRYATGQGFVATQGQALELVGFFEGEDYEISQITDLGAGTAVVLREESGRPLWAGGGRWRS